MASIENAGDGDGLAAEVDGEVSSLEDPTGPILFKKSSTVLVGTGILELLLPRDEDIGATRRLAGGISANELDFCLSFRLACAALRAKSSCLRCCSISWRLAGEREGLPPGTKGAAFADSEEEGSVTLEDLPCRLLAGDSENEGGRRDVSPVTSRFEGSRRLHSTKT